MPKSEGNGIEDRLLQHFRNSAIKSQTYKNLYRHFADEAARGEIAAAIGTLIQQGKIYETEKGRLRLSRDSRETIGVRVTGKVSLTGAGSAFVITPQADDDIFIPKGQLGTACQGDTVEVLLYKRQSGRRREGQIVAIKERAREFYVGTVEPIGKNAFVVPDRRKVSADIFVRDVSKLHLRSGQRVIARVLKWEEGAKNPLGEIVEVLGTVGEHDVEMRSIIVDNGFFLRFQQDVLDEAEAIPLEPSEAELSSRKDFRNITTFTIDPDDAKDFDDALSIRKLPNGRWEIGVHIADVCHYVKPNTALDRAAYKRATSVYIVDRVAPMLPERLSNLICSLRPNEEKLCFAAVFEMDEQAKVHKHWIGRTVIRSDKRFTYDEVQKLMVNPKGPFAKEITLLNKLATKLREVRFRNGSIAFETVELKFELDVQGVPIAVFEKEHTESHMLIEDFMLLANQTVAEEIGKARVSRKGESQRPRPFVYRIHDRPNDKKLEDFGRFAAQFGYKLKFDSLKSIKESLNKLLEDVKGKPEQNALEQLAIRAMAKAVYSINNIGHFGLGFSHYTHFTSPIRRYPDIMVHRLLEDYMNGRRGPNPVLLEEQCRHSSDMERSAMVAERESMKYKQVEFMQDKMGKTYQGVVTGVTSIGLFVEITETRCEGLVNIRSLQDDFYVYDEPGFRLYGLDTGREFRLGDKVKVRVSKTDLVRRTIDLDLQSEHGHRHQKSNKAKNKQ